MPKVICTVFDTKAEIFNVPINFDSKDDAKRAFFDACSDSNTLLGRHPEDFKLYLVGKFDVLSGALVVVDRTCITDGTEFLMWQAQHEEEK